ncbi:MAG: response regulator [Vicinamibacterales bacterium]
MPSREASTPEDRGRRTIRLVVVDDHPLFRKGLVDLIHDEPGLQVCGEAATISEALSVIAAEAPSVAVVDLSLGDESGLDLIASLAAHHPGVHVLVLSGHDERVHADRALKAGALGYIMKDKAATELLSAIRRVAAGKSYVSEETAERILTTLGGVRTPSSQSPLDRLSDRERHVLTLMGRGVGTRDIAAQLDLSVKTVESHYAHIKEKLGIRTGRELMRAAVMWAEVDRI